MAAHSKIIASANIANVRRYKHRSQFQQDIVIWYVTHVMVIHTNTLID
jgi:hypothetical protein